MVPEIAVIISSKSQAFRWKLFGQSLLERNIRLLRVAGVKKVYLDLAGEDISFYNSNVRKYLKFNDIEIISGKPDNVLYLSIEANQFILFGAFSAFDENFLLLKNIYTPVKKPSQFIVNDNTDLSNAKKIATEVIRTGSGGKLAQNFNKRISIPLSLLLAQFRISPNAITIFNFLLGIMSIIFLLSNRHIDQAIGGILVQSCSIIDGCDGEVARMTTRFSKLGGIFDTASDQLLAAALILVASSKVYIHFSPLLFWINFISVVGGVGIMVFCIIYFMRRYSESMSFASFSREFIELLPRTDYWVKSIKYLQYMPRKELYSLLVCIFCLFNALHYYMMFFTLVAIAGAIIDIVLCMKYFPHIENIRLSRK